MARISEALECSQDEIDELRSLTQDTNQPRIAERATLVLEFIKGATITDIAQRYSVQPHTVIKWKRRYAEQGIDGLRSLPRGNTKDVYGKDFRKRLVALVNSPPPNGAPYWTGPMLAEELNVPLYAVHVYLRKSGIRLLELRKASEFKNCEAKANTQSADGTAKESDEAEGGDALKVKENNGNRLDVEVMLIARDISGTVAFKAESGGHGILSAENHFDGTNLSEFLGDMDSNEKGLYAIVSEATSQFIQSYKEYSIKYEEQEPN